MKTTNPQKRSIMEQVYKFGLSSISRLNSFLPEAANSGSYILCYHAIDNDNWSFTITPNDFVKQMEYLKKSKNIVKLSEIISPDSKKDNNQVAITFDDGYESVCQNALPILRKLKIPATVFVLGDNVNPDRKEMSENKKLLSIQQIKELHQVGWEIGFHSKTHAYTRALDKNRLRKEIINGKKEFEEKLGISLRYFAYPRGIYTDKIIRTVKKAGFEAAFTVDGEALKKTIDPYRIPRTVLDRNRDMQQFKALLSPLGLWLGSKRISVLKLEEHLNYRIHKLTVNL